ncbi:MAG: Fe-S cluster assembly protein IscX [Anaerolineae bacterium]|nr:Fe-S cluster assembly protein IscX [Thermoflexales bacterium]MDW8407819.1 Fe-S cluster assembly protein IscX [Anaerolineae bacterium]
MITEAISNPLYWDDAYPIALLLKARYPDVEPVEIDQATLREWVMALPGFNDDPAVVCAEWLDDIRREWLEIGGVR